MLSPGFLYIMDTMEKLRISTARESSKNIFSLCPVEFREESSFGSFYFRNADFGQVLIETQNKEAMKFRFKLNLNDGDNPQRADVKKRRGAEMNVGRDHTGQKTRTIDRRKRLSKGKSKQVPFRSNETDEVRDARYSETREPEGCFREHAHNADRREEVAALPLKHPYRAVRFAKPGQSESRLGCTTADVDTGCFYTGEEKLDKRAIQKKLARNIDAKLDVFRSQLGAEFGQEYAGPTQSGARNGHVRFNSPSEKHVLPDQWHSQRNPMESRPVAVNGQQQRKNAIHISNESSFVPYKKKPLHISQKPEGKANAKNRKSDTRPKAIKSVQETTWDKYQKDAFNAINLEALEKIPEMFDMVCSKKRGSKTSDTMTNQDAQDMACKSRTGDCGHVDDIMESILGKNARSMKILRSAAGAYSERGDADEESAWTNEESRVTREFDDQTTWTKSSSYVREQGSDDSGSDFGGESTWADDKSYWTERTGNDTYYHSQRNICGWAGLDGESVWTERTNGSYRTYPRSERTSYNSRELDDESRWTEKTGGESYYHDNRNSYREKEFDGESLWTGITDVESGKYDEESQWTEDRTEGESHYRRHYHDGESQWTDERTEGQSYCKRNRYEGESVWTEDRKEGQSYSSYSRTERDSNDSRGHDGESLWTRRTDGDTYYSRHGSTDYDDETV
jgi:hypothetical protein